ncbi:MAG: DUF4249 family protein [Bacteroidota bacterium]
MLNIKKIISFLLISLTFYACGESSVEIGQNTYSPKIVIDGLLYPGNKVENIRITRNIPLNTQLEPEQVILFAADVKLQDMQNGNIYQLTFNPTNVAFEYNGNDLEIGYDKSYKLSVAAYVDGNLLQASSITKTPNAGFRINDSESYIDSIKYQEKDDNGNDKQLFVKFAPSPGTNYYAISIVALDASLDNFIYDNSYFEVKPKDLEKDFDRYKYQFRWLQNVNSSSNNIEYQVEWLNVWFYSRYRMIIYAADDNYRLFAQTHRNVQEFDGNFHEPRMNIEGDGIGVFGSAITDTVYFKVIK